MKIKNITKNIKTILAVTAFSLFTVNVSIAQDAKSTEIINGLINKMKTSKSVMGDFVLTMKDAKGTLKNKLNGKFTLKGEKFFVDLSEQSITSDGSAIYTFLKKNNEVQISNAASSDNTVSPTKLFNGEFLKTFNYKFLGSTTFLNKKVDVIELTPKTSSRSYSKVQLFIDPLTKLITGGNVYEKSGSFMSYAIKNINTSKSVNDATFKFDVTKYKNIEVIDLR